MSRLTTFRSLLLAIAIATTFAFSPHAEAANYRYVENYFSDPRINNTAGATVIDSHGDLITYGNANYPIVKFASTTGEMIAHYGTWGGSGNGQFETAGGNLTNYNGATLKVVGGIVLDSSDNMYVADIGNHRIQEFDSSGNYIRQWGTSGSGNGQFLYPAGLARDSSGNIYVVDTLNYRVQKFTSTGTFVSKFGTQGVGNGQLYFPRFIAIDAGNNVYVTDYNQSAYEKFNSSGVYVTRAATSMRRAGGIAIDSSDRIWLFDTFNNGASFYQFATTSTNLTSPLNSFAASSTSIFGISVDRYGSIYAADQDLATQKYALGSNYTWTGAGNGTTWASAANWSPSTGYPTTTDSAYFIGGTSPNSAVLVNVPKVYSLNTTNTWSGAIMLANDLTVGFGSMTFRNGNFQFLGRNLTNQMDFTGGGLFDLTQGGGGTTIVDCRNGTTGLLYCTYDGNGGGAFGTTTIQASRSSLGLGYNNGTTINGPSFFVDGNLALGTSTHLGSTPLILLGGNVTFAASSSIDTTFRLTGNTQTLTSTGDFAYYRDGLKKTTGSSITFDPDIGVGLYGYGGDLDLQGVLGSLMSLVSSQPGTQWPLTFDSFGTLTLKYLSIQDAKNILPNNLYCYPGCVDAGNNSDNIIFGPRPIAVGLREYQSNLIWGSSGAADGQFGNANGIVLDAAGNVVVADIDRGDIQKFDAEGNFISKWGNYQYLAGIARSSDGNIFVLDANNYTVRKYDSDGNALAPAWGQYGLGDADFADPVGIAVDGSDNVYILDTFNGNVKKFDSSGNFILKFGYFPDTLNNPGAPFPDGAFDNPQGIMADAAGNIYIADNSQIDVQKYDSNGNFIMKFGGEGNHAPDMQDPVGVAIDPQGNIYVGDDSDQNIQIYDSSGGYLTQLGEYGSAPGELFGPYYMALSTSTGDMYVVERWNHRIQKFTQTVDTTSTTADLNAAIDDLGEDTPTDRGFVYGLTTAYGATTTESGSFSTGDFSTTLTGLSCSTTYHYAGYSTNSTGTFYSADSTFRTGACAVPTLSTGGVTYVSQWGSLPHNGYFHTPYYSTFDSNGNMYVVDSNTRYIQKFDSAGDFVLEWGGGPSGSGNGEFWFPQGIVADSADNIFIVDRFNHRIQKFDSSGNYLSQFGTNGSGDGEFSYPIGIAIDSADNIYIGDTSNNRIQKFDSSGNYLSQWGVYGTADGEFSAPSGVAVDSFDKVYVVDAGNSRIQKFSSLGNYELQFGAPGSGDGEFAGGMVGIAIDSSGNLYVTDTASSRVQKFNSSGAFVTKWGTSGPGQGEFNYPNGVSVNPAGHVFIGDVNNHRIQEFTSVGVYVSDFGDGRAIAYFFSDPWDIVHDSQNNIYLLDDNLSSVKKFDSDGTFILQFGTIGSNPGEFDYVNAMTIDTSDNIYVLDENRGKVIKFTSGGVYVSEFGEFGSSDGEFDDPFALAVDTQGDIYVYDDGKYSVQKFDNDGNYILKWGTNGSSNGEFDAGSAMVADSEDNIYITDWGNYNVQKFDSDGNFLLKWGTNGSGNGEFDDPNRIAVDSDNNVYVTDDSNLNVQKFNSDGNFLLSWGTEGTGNGEFEGVWGVTVTDEGYAYTADWDNENIQKFSLRAIVTQTTADLIGSITDVGSSNATARGFVYGLTTAYGATTTENGSFSVETFDTSLASLTCGTTYHYAAYATNGQGTGYGVDDTFITDSCGGGASVPTVTTSAASSVANTSVTGNGNITATGGATVTVRGFVYGATTAYGATTTESGSFSTGAYTGSITSLTCNTLYHYTAYATNSQGTSYGSDTTFTTSACGGTTAPTVSTSAASSLSTTAATLNGSVSSTGGAAVTTRGFAYGTTATYGATTTESGSFSTGSFTGSITSLICATAYHYAAYGTNTAGTGYGSDTTFTTDACASSGGGGGGGSGSSGGGSSTVSAGQLPVVTTEVMTTVTETVLRPDDFSDDLDVGSTDDQVLKLQKHLNKHGFKVNDKGAGSPGLETTYFGDATRKAVMAYQKAHGIIPPNGKIGSKTREALNKEAKEDALSGNSSATSVVKTLVTTPVVTKTGAEVHGELVSLGKSPVTVRGFAYGPTAVYGATTTESGQFSLGSFTRTISSLRCQTTYHYASYATNGSGTGYGRDMTFTTSSCAGVDEPITTPPVMTPPPAVVCPYLTKPINMGNNNDPVEVRRLQQFLGTPVTGIYSNTDYQAVKRFQETYKDDILTSLHLSNGTGAVSTNTLKKINALMCGTTPPPVTPPQTPQPVPPPVIPTTQPIPQPVSCTSSPTYSLDLSVGSQNNEVLILQRFLNAHGYVLAASGPGSPGNETNLYGTLTEAAVKNLQRINSISPVTGTVGPKTRRLLNCGTVNSIPPAGASTEIPGPGATPPITSSTKPTVITGTSTELKESTTPSSSRQ